MTVLQRLVVVRGPGEERAPLAQALAEQIEGPVVHVCGDDLLHGWVLRGLPEYGQQSDAIYKLLRLVTITYLKEGFSVVVDAPFYEEHNHGVVALRTTDITDLTRLAKTFRGIHTGVVTFRPSHGVPRPLLDAIDRDAIEGEVRVIPALEGDDAAVAKEILARLQ